VIDSDVHSKRRFTTTEQFIKKQSENNAANEEQQFITKRTSVISNYRNPTMHQSIHRQTRGHLKDWQHMHTNGGDCSMNERHCRSR